MRLALVLLAAICSNHLTAAVTTASAHYHSAGAECEGVLMYDGAWTTPRPGVLVVHDWMGITERTRKAADELVKLGYVALCVDIYGKGVRPATPAEAGKLSGSYKADRTLLRARMRSGFEMLAAMNNVQAKRIGAIGYCFGGTAALELAHSGAPVAATVSFHGGLATLPADEAKNITGKVLILHGADDPHVKPAELAAFEQSLRATRVDWQVVSYGNAVHGFTHEGAGSDNASGYAYHPDAARRSWKAMGELFEETFAAR